MLQVPQILHRFVSSVADDPTIPEAVRPQKDWNDNHIITGGNDGDLFVVDSTSLDGFSFQAVNTIVSGRLEQIVQGAGSFAGTGGTGILAPTVLTLTKTSNVFALFRAGIADTSGILANCVFFEFRNGVTINQSFILNNLQQYLFLDYLSLPAGVYTYGGGFTANVNPITSSAVSIYLLAFG